MGTVLSICWSDPLSRTEVIQQSIDGFTILIQQAKDEQFDIEHEYNGLEALLSDSSNRASSERDIKERMETLRVLSHKANERIMTCQTNWNHLTDFLLTMKQRNVLAPTLRVTDPDEQQKIMAPFKRLGQLTQMNADVSARAPAPSASLWNYIPGFGTYSSSNPYQALPSSELGPVSAFIDQERKNMEASSVHQEWKQEREPHEETWFEEKQDELHKQKRSDKREEVEQDELHKQKRNSKREEVEQQERLEHSESQSQPQSPVPLGAVSSVTVGVKTPSQVPSKSRRSHKSAVNGKSSSSSLVAVGL